MSAAAWLASCELCEHRCRVDRTRGDLGFCRLPAQARAYRAFLHHGEEAEISPTFAVFVSGCSFRCAYCSDATWVAHPERGELVEPARLAARIAAAAAGAPPARTVSFVGGNPDENLAALLPVIDELRGRLPVVWNSNLYLTPEPLAALLGRVAVFVPDLKFGNDACAERVAGARRYTEVLHRNLRAVHGRARLVVRHLVMPGHVECCTAPVARFVARELPRATLNLMTQYEPLFAGFGPAGEMRRRPTAAELEAAWDAARGAGVASLWRDGRPEGAASAGAGRGEAAGPHDSRILIREDGSVVIEHAGGGLEQIAAALRGDPRVG